MSRTQTLRLIIGREITDRLKNKVYVLGTAAVTVAIAAAILIPGLLGDDAQHYKLGVVGQVPTPFATALDGAAGPDMEVELIDLDDRAAASAAVTDGTVDAALIDAAVLMSEGGPPMALRGVVEAALQRAETLVELEAAGLTDEQLAVVLTPATPLVVVDPTGEEADPFGGEVIAFLATLMLFIAVTANAGSLLSGAVEEKASRVIEVLLGSVRPWQLLLAKIIALTALALAQVGLVVAVAFGANAAVGTFDVPAATAPTVVISLVMLVIGFVFYAALYTVAGSLASTNEDAQGSAGPLGFVVMGAYFVVAFVVLPNPHGVWAQVLTYLPPTAPLTVPARVALDAIPLWQVVVASAVTLGGVVLTVALAARLYSASLLAGGKLTWRQAWHTEPIR